MDISLWEIIEVAVRCPGVVCRAGQGAHRARVAVNRASRASAGEITVAVRTAVTGPVLRADPLAEVVVPFACDGAVGVVAAVENTRGTGTTGSRTAVAQRLAIRAGTGVAVFIYVAVSIAVSVTICIAVFLRIQAVAVCCQLQHSGPPAP